MPVRRGRSRPDPQRRRQALLARLGEPGCLLCRDEIGQTQRYWFWFINESYGEPPIIVALRGSNGFCPRHSRHLLATGGPRLVTAVQSYVIGAPLERVRTALVLARRGTTPSRVARALVPPRPCPACLSEQEHRRREGALLADALADEEVHDHLVQARGICWLHWRTLAGKASWGRLRALTRLVAAILEGASEEGGLRASWSVLQGEDADRIARQAPGEVRRDATPPAAPGAWSPTVGWLRRWLALPGCPLCLGRRAALVEFLAWLDREVQERPDRWRDLTELCPTHAWDFAALADPGSLRRLAETLRGQRLAALGRLREQLETEPSRLPWRRLGEASRRLGPAPGGGDLRHLRPRRLGAVLGAALESPEARLKRLLARAVPDRPCPACEALRTRTHRLADLLGHALRDPETARVYRDQRGACLHHLAILVGASPSGQEATLVLETELARLEVLRWELEETLRKESWSVRYETEGDEQSAGRRASEQLAGSGLEERSLIGV
ncbi:MAG TPA: hypothetical protein VFD01_18300 [Candidatus Dormibacteraeota bacterium]|nr:hypothetical protein [Candidatus Dormibacteraeota bacterium]